MRNYIPIDVKAIRHFCVDQGIRKDTELAARVGVSASNIQRVMKKGTAGPATVLLLEQFVGKKLRLEDNHEPA